MEMGTRWEVGCGWWVVRVKGVSTDDKASKYGNFATERRHKELRPCWAAMSAIVLVTFLNPLTSNPTTTHHPTPSPSWRHLSSSCLWAGFLEVFLFG